MIRRGLRWAGLAAMTVASVSARAADEARVLYPNGHAPAAVGGPEPVGLGSLSLVGAVLLAGAGGWIMLRGRKAGLVRREVRQLAIDETRSLGNRQFLVLASCHGKKFLLGVCPGRIELLAPVDAATSMEKPR